MAAKKPFYKGNNTGRGGHERMHVISRRRLREAARRYPDAAEALDRWYRVVHAADWESLHDVRRVYRHADAVTVGSGNAVTVFNVCGNKYRLVAAIHYNRRRVYVLRFLTHAEYGRGRWQEQL